MKNTEAIVTGRFTTIELVVIALLAALGIAVKPFVQPLIKLITATLKVPSGTIGGFIYMFWPVVAVAMTGKPGAATLLSFVQALIAYIIGFGSHGIANFPAYLLPGIVIDLTFLISGDRGSNYIVGAVAGALGNAVGVAFINLVLFRMPYVALIFTVIVGMISGAIGGLAAIFVGRETRRYYQ